MPEIASLTPGDRWAGPLAVRATKGVSPYADGFFLTLELGDATGELPAKVWLGPDEDAAKRLDAELAVGDVVDVTARATEYRERLELSIEIPPEILDPDTIDATDFVPASEHHLGRLTRNLLGAARSIEHDALRQLVLDVWTDETLQDALVHAPATKRHHRAHLGGLVEHTHAMLVLAEALVYLHAELDRDLLIAAVLLHGLGKLDEHETTAAIEITDAGRLAGPVALTDARLTRRLDQSDLDPEHALRLRHAVLAHRGRGEGSPVSPRTPEAVALRGIERLDVDVARTLQAAEAMREEETTSGWSKMTRGYLDVWQASGSRDDEEVRSVGDEGDPDRPARLPA